MTDGNIGSLLSAEEAKQVRQAIEAVEQKTAGELMVVVAGRSDHYADVRALVALVSAVGSAWVLYWFLPTVPSAYIFASQVLLWLLFWWVTGLGAVVRVLVPSSRLAAAVDAKAKAVFLDHGLTETRDRSGVLIFVSELERRIQILGDRGIHEQVGAEGWAREVSTIARSFGANSPAAGLCEAVSHIGAKLAEAFPPRPDDVNELSDHVRYVD